MRLIRKKDLHTALWSGGTTTQIAIYPNDANYSERRFTWRISSAEVEVEESIFTSLPGVQRILMVLEGQLKLEHEGHRSCILKRFDQDSFSGDWSTKSVGKVTDFNLMLKGDATGTVEAINLESSMFIDNRYNESYNNNTIVIYCYNGEAKLLDDIILNSGDSIILDDYRDDIKLESLQNEVSEIIVVKIAHM